MYENRIVVAMSGGVDSSVSAAILKDEGYDVIGITMRFWGEDNRCCSVEDVEDARIVAHHLDIPHYVISFEESFKKHVVDYFISDPTGYDSINGGWQQFNDQIQSIQSYTEGVYFDNGINYYSGFNRKENKYYANLINTSTAKPNEILFGESMSGIKGRFATVKFSTDSTTDPGGSKELWSVGTKVNYIR